MVNERRVKLLVQIQDQLRSLLNGTRTRSEVSEWALRCLDAEDSVAIADPVVLRALHRLAVSDGETGPGEFLYSEPDFHLWLDEVENALEGS